MAALNGPQDEVVRFRQAFEARRNLVVDGIRRMNGLTLAPPEGAFYAYIGCAALIGRTDRARVSCSRTTWPSPPIC